MNTTTLIEKLCMADGISGREEQVREQIIQVIDGHCDWKVDARGNLLPQKGKQTGKEKVMITAHMDEAGFMLTGIREDGLLPLPMSVILTAVLYWAKLSALTANNRRHRNKADSSSDQRGTGQANAAV